MYPWGGRPNSPGTGLTHFSFGRAFSPQPHGPPAPPLGPARTPVTTRGGCHRSVRAGRGGAWAGEGPKRSAVRPPHSGAGQGRLQPHPRLVRSCTQHRARQACWSISSRARHARGGLPFARSRAANRLDRVAAPSLRARTTHTAHTRHPLPSSDCAVRSARAGQLIRAHRRRPAAPRRPAAARSPAPRNATAGRAWRAATPGAPAARCRRRCCRRRCRRRRAAA
jgi:hypothetical protein